MTARITMRAKRARSVMRSFGNEQEWSPMRGRHRRPWDRPGGIISRGPSKQCVCGTMLYQDRFTEEWYEVWGPNEMRQKHYCQKGAINESQTDESNRREL